MSVTHLDARLAEHANAFAVHHDGWEDAARFWASASELVFLIGIVLFIAVAALRRRWTAAATGVLAVVAAGVGLVVGHFLSSAVDRARPFVAHPQIHPFLHHAADASFPSDHATAAFAIAVVLLVRLGLRTLPVLIAAAALCVARVLVGVHYPGDVLAGAALGSLAALAVCWVAARPRVVAAAHRVTDRVGGPSPLPRG